MKNDFLKDYFMDCKEVVYPAQKNELHADETADKVMNIVRSMTKEIYDSINRIACYMGVPCRSTNIIEQETPARMSGEKIACNGYIGYTVDLKPYRKMFAAVRFCAAAPAEDEDGVVRGVIIDEDGNVEAIAPGGKVLNHKWTRLPLSEKSSLLVATVPVDENGAPLFVPKYVEFLPDGVVQTLSEYMSGMMNFDNEINNRVNKIEQKLSACCDCAATES